MPNRNEIRARTKRSRDNERGPLTMDEAGVCTSGDSEDVDDAGRSHTQHVR